MKDLPSVEDALAPVRQALLRRAEERAAAIRAAAAADAAEMRRQARREAEDILAQARERGEADAAAVAAAERAHTRRQARAVVLAAQRWAYEELRRRVGAAVAALRRDPDYPRLCDRLAEAARQAAGGPVLISEHPDGGILAEGPDLVVDGSLPHLADQAVAALGAEVSALWEP